MSPLFASSHLTPAGAVPVLSQCSSIGAFSYAPFFLSVSISTFLAASTCFSVAKVKGEENVADGLTKHVDRRKMEQHMEACSMVQRSGRRDLCPRLGDGK